SGSAWAPATICRLRSATPAPPPLWPRPETVLRRRRPTPARSRRSSRPAGRTMLAEGYTARPARLDDAAAVAAVIARNQLVDFGAVEVDESEVRDDWAGVDLEADTLLIERDGEVVALSDLLVRPGQVN